MDKPPPTNGSLWEVIGDFILFVNEPCQAEVYLRDGQIIMITGGFCYEDLRANQLRWQLCAIIGEKVFGFNNVNPEYWNDCFRSASMTDQNNNNVPGITSEDWDMFQDVWSCESPEDKETEGQLVPGSLWLYLHLQRAPTNTILRNGTIPGDIQNNRFNHPYVMVVKAEKTPHLIASCLHQRAATYLGPDGWMRDEKTIKTPPASKKAWKVTLVVDEKISTIWIRMDDWRVLFEKAEPKDNG